MPKILRRFLRCPVTPLLAGAVFIGSVLALPMRWHGGSAVGTWLWSNLLRDRGTHCVFPYAQQWYVPGSNGFTAVPYEQHAAAANNPSSVLASVDIFESGPSGIWALTSRRQWINITFDNTGLTPAQAAALRAQYINDLIKAGDPMLPRELPGILTTDVDRSTILWSGWAHNAISLLSFIAMTASLPALPRWARERRRQRQGLCPACAYDLRATPPGFPCPECGHPSPGGHPSASH